MRTELTDCLRTARTFVGLTLAFAGAAQSQPVTHRPITDFTNAQVHGAIGMSTTSTCIPPQCAGRLAAFDYPGLSDRVLSALGRPLGTTIDGSITERLLPDGRADVQVVLHTTNALTWVSTWDPTDPNDNVLPFPENPLLFGFRLSDIVANPAIEPALGDVHLVLAFKNTAPAAPLPDLVGWLALGIAAPGQELVSIYIDATATGSLREAANLGPEGTPGKCVVTETGVLFRGPFKGATADGFPVEKVDLHAIGR